MDTRTVAETLVSLCQQGKNDEAMRTLYSPDIVSVEAFAAPGGSREVKGIPAVQAKGEWWMSSHDFNGPPVIEGPLVTGSHFAVRFQYDVTVKATGQRMVLNELGVYQVANGKIVREEFFYAM